MVKILLPALFLASAITTLASPGLAPCTAQSLSAYDTAYAPPSLGCAIGILDYSNFTYQNITNGPSASSLLVTPNGQGFGFTAVNGSPIAASAGETVEFAIYYNIFIDPAPIIAGADSSLDPPMGNVNITTYYCNDSVLYPGTTSCFPPTSTAYSLTVTTQTQTASIVFPVAATSYETVGIVFTLIGPASFDGFDTSSDVVGGSDVVGAAPEPASLTLVGLLLGAGGLALRRKTRS